MRSFQHIAPALRLFHGPDSLAQLGRELTRLDSRRAIIVCGSSLARQSGLIDKVRAGMGERCAGVVAGVRAHSPVPAVEDTARELKRLEADAVVAVGGGSAIVTARAASILLAERGDVASLSTSRDAQGELRSPKLMAPKLPQLIVPTTPTTAMAKAGSAVFDPLAGERRALFDPKTRAQAIFIDPDLAASAPAELVVTASLNTFSLAIEGLMSRAGNPMADGMLMHALRLLLARLGSPDTIIDPTARGDLMVAAVLCGQGTDATGAGMTTVLGHAIGANHDVENGTANAIVLPAVLRFNAEAARPGLEKVAAALELGRSDDRQAVSGIVGAVTALFAKLGVPPRLRDVGVPREALPGIAERGIGDWFLRGNPRPVRDASELHQVLEEAW
jgi:alcohol dehydrogenase class IV